MFESESVFVAPVSVEVAFGLFPMTATSAVQCLIVGVVEGAVSGVDFGLAVGLGAPGRIPDGDPLGIAFEPASHNCCSFVFARVRSGGRACCALVSVTAQLFPRGPLSQIRRARAESWTREAERCMG